MLLELRSLLLLADEARCKWEHGITRWKNDRIDGRLRSRRRRLSVTFNELGKQYHIVQVAIDRWNATQLATQLAGDGFRDYCVWPGLPQHERADEEARRGRARKATATRRIRCQWLASNISIEQDAADNWKPSKKKSCERIDGIVALIMGLDLAARQIIFDEYPSIIL